MTTEMQTLSQRVGRSERENRILKVLALLGVALFATLLLMGASGKPRTIEAEKFILRDNQGHARVTIGTPESAGVAVDTKPTDPVIWLTDEKGADRAILTTDGIRFADALSKPTVDIVSEPGKSTMRLYGPNREVSWSAP
jgi:hypothetical protein